MEKLLASRTVAEEAESYLGFVIREEMTGLVADPDGWPGPRLHADTLPRIRKQIWSWWYRLQQVV